MYASSTQELLLQKDLHKYKFPSFRFQCTLDVMISATQHRLWGCLNLKLKQKNEVESRLRFDANIKCCIFRLYNTGGRNYFFLFLLNDSNAFMNWRIFVRIISELLISYGLCRSVTTSKILNISIEIDSQLSRNKGVYLL